MPDSAAEAAVRSALAEQAGWCRTLRSPLTAQLCELLATREWPEGRVADRLRRWAGNPQPTSDAVPLRLCGGLHAGVRAGWLPGLAAHYPPHPLPSPDAMWPAVADALTHPRFEPWLDSPPQTNEVGRSAALLPGLLTFASRFPAPIRLLELGASAGLNLQLDRFAYHLGERDFGDADSAVRIAPHWQGPPPPAASLHIAERAGVDRNPLDPRRDGERLLAYVWADQQQRLVQLEAALALAAARPIAVDQGDAADWLEARLAEPFDGATIVMHSIAFQYFPPQTKARVAAALGGAGDAATDEAPLGWLRFERDGPSREAYLRLRSWPGGEERLLARCHPHGAAISWLDDRAR